MVHQIVFRATAAQNLKANYVRSMCKNYTIKMIKSRPYHPQSQGKVERSHRSLRIKIMYDFINLGEKGTHWASNLASYNHILNEESKEELEWNSPFEVYFGRKSNILVKASLQNVADLNDCIIKAPKRKDYRCHFRNVKKLRKRAQLYSKRMNERMVDVTHVFTKLQHTKVVTKFWCATGKTGEEALLSSDALL